MIVTVDVIKTTGGLSLVALVLSFIKGNLSTKMSIVGMEVRCEDVP
jgi:hypothetical protein